MVTTLGFHPKNTGSIPVNSRIKSVQFSIKTYYKFSRLKQYKSNFLFFKMSLLLIMWLSLVTNESVVTKNVKLISFKKNKKIIYFSKAPMAHKTNSLEHFSIPKNSYKLCSKNFTSIIYGAVEEVLLINFVLKKTIKKISTNVFLIEAYDVPVLIKYGF